MSKPLAVASVREGDVLADKYRVERVIGSGGMGVVVTAQHLQLGQRVAIKMLRPEACENPETVARFLREARAAVRIQSEHVARVLDVGTLDDGAPYTVMEYLAGSDLEQVVHSGRKLTVHEAVDWVLQASEAHALGIVHRDLKPANLFLASRADGTPLVKVLDFGISKAAICGPDEIQQASITSTLAVIGSPLYMSPEQMRSAKNVDVRTDVWSLGAILYELLAGHPPFVADTLPGLCAMIASDPPMPLRGERDDVPVPLAELIEQCLEKQPSKRPQNVGELATALAPFAPRSARLSIERIVRVVRASGASTPEPVPSEPPPAVSPDAVTRAVADASTGGAPGAATAAGWEGAGIVTAQRFSSGTAIALLAAVVLASAGALALFRYRAPSPTGVASGAPSDALVPPVHASASASSPRLAAPSSAEVAAQGAADAADTAPRTAGSTRDAAAPSLATAARPPEPREAKAPPATPSKTKPGGDKPAKGGTVVDPLAEPN
jgi:serine/threonine-protein kinase